MIHKIPPLTIAAAGLIHLVMAPEHYGHSTVHGLFFAIAGLLEIAWAVLYWRKPSTPLHTAGIALAGGLVVLWVVTRIAAPPFESSPAPLEASGVLCKLCELSGAVVLAVLLLKGQAQGMEGYSPARSTGMALLLALVGGLSVFGIGKAAEEALPGLAGSGHTAENGYAHGSDQMEHDHRQGQQEQPAEPVNLPGGYQISNAWARPGAAGQKSAVYFTLNNPTPEEDLLTGAAAAVAQSVEIHLSEVDASGIARMRPQESVEIPSGWQVTFKPGGLHIMLIGLLQDLEPGDSFTMILQLQKAGALELQVDVREP